MRALTIRQPYAWAVMLGEKDVENRTWHTNHRGSFWVHASGSRSTSDSDFWSEVIGLEVPDTLPEGAILGTVELVDVVRGHKSAWAMAEEGVWHWILANPKPLAEPILGVKGKPRWWEFQGETAAATRPPLPDVDRERALRDARKYPPPRGG